MNSQPLKPCPFCESIEDYLYKHPEHCFLYLLAGPMDRFRYSIKAPKYIKKWNTRSAPEPEQGELSE